MLSCLDRNLSLMQIRLTRCCFVSGAVGSMMFVHDGKYFCTPVVKIHADVNHYTVFI